MHGTFYSNHVKALKIILLGSWLMKMNFVKKTLTSLKGSSVNNLVLNHESCKACVALTGKRFESSVL